MRTLMTLNRPSRKEAYRIAGAVHDGRTLTDEERDLLLNYFSPAPPKIAKDAFSWVAKACGVQGKDPREALCVVHVKSGEAIACDGHRIHWAPSTLADGQYDPRTGSKLAEEISHRYDFDKVKGQLHEGREVSLADLPLVDPPPDGKIKAIKVGDKTGINAAYVREGFNATGLSGVAFIKDDKLLTAKSPFGTFSVMALRL